MVFKLQLSGHFLLGSSSKPTERRTAAHNFAVVVRAEVEIYFKLCHFLSSVWTGRYEWRSTTSWPSKDSASEYLDRLCWWR